MSRIVTIPSGSNPGETFSSRNTLVPRSAAPESSTSATATCNPTSANRARLSPLPCVERTVFRAPPAPPRDARHAGITPKSNPVSSERPNAAAATVAAWFRLGVAPETAGDAIPLFTLSNASGAWTPATVEFLSLRAGLDKDILTALGEEIEGAAMIYTCEPDGDAEGADPVLQKPVGRAALSRAWESVRGELVV